MSLVVKRSTSLAVKRFMNLVVKRFMSLVVKRFMSLAVKRPTSLAVKRFMNLVVKGFTSLAVKRSMSLAVKRFMSLAVKRPTSLAATSSQSHKCSLTWYMVALYTAMICEFFVERLCSGLWSSSFSVFPPLEVFFGAAVLQRVFLVSFFFQFFKACTSSCSFRM